MIWRLLFLMILSTVQVQAMGKPKSGDSENPKMCAADVKACPDGSFVGRDPMNDCKFKDCDTTACSASKESESCEKSKPNSKPGGT